MFRKIDDHKHTASVHRGMVTALYDDGWDNLINFKLDCGTDVEAVEWLKKDGWEEYDPNAALKAAGFVWNGRYYEKGGAG